MIKVLISELLLQKGEDSAALVSLLDNLSQPDQKKILFAVLKYLSENFPTSVAQKASPSSNAAVSAVAGAISRLVASSETRMDHLVAWLTASSGAGLGDGVAIRRAVVAVVARDKDSLITVLEKSIAQFGDQLYTKHSPMLQQEGTVSHRTCL
jgi:telomere length regulation protein